MTTSIVGFSKALADTTRWRIIRLVRGEALCVCELADILRMPQSSVSSHVQIIRRAGLLEGETCGKWTYFRIQRRYLRLISAMEKLFPMDPAWKGDEAKAAARLRCREESCCPGPKKLARRTSRTTIHA